MPIFYTEFFLMYLVLQWGKSLECILALTPMAFTACCHGRDKLARPALVNRGSERERETRKEIQKIKLISYPKEGKKEREKEERERKE